MTDRLIILGAGGHARVVADALVAAGRDVIGFVDANPSVHGARLLGLPVLGADEVLDSFSPADTELANGIGSAGTPDARQRVYQAGLDRGFRFATVVHPTAIVAESATLGSGAQVLARAVIQPLAVIGANTIINTGAIIEHDVVIGSHTHISPGCVLAGEVRVGDLVHVGVGSIVIQRLSVGTRSLVAAGAVVVEAVAAGSRVMGIPARVQA
jgi:sugar O-acyltransferase (sialic acid O-acetyltransferase NeuD family)